MSADLNAILEPGMLVRHPSEPDWGLGQVQSNIGGRITVNFDVKFHKFAWRAFSTGFFLNESIFINQNFCIPDVSVSLYRNICVCLC